MRTFVAIDLDEHARASVGTVLDRFRTAISGVLWVRPDSMHMTLKFLGEIEKEDLPAVLEAARAAATAAEPFRMRCGGVSGFPLRGTPRVIYVAVEEPTGRLAALAQALEDRMEADACIPREERGFTAHVTLGRLRHKHTCPPLSEVVRLAGHVPPWEMAVEEIVLMRSHRTPLGAAYERLAHIRLGR